MPAKRLARANVQDIVNLLNQAVEVGYSKAKSEMPKTHMKETSQQHYLRHAIPKHLWLLARASAVANKQTVIQWVSSAIQEKLNHEK